MTHDERPALQGVAVWGGAHPARVRDALRPFAFRHPVKLPDLLAWCDQHLSRGALPASDPRHLGLLDAGCHPSAEAVVSRYADLDLQLAVWGAAPYAVEVEQHTLRALAACLPYPAEHAQFTSGGAESNLLAMTLAMARAVPDWIDNGNVAVHGRPTVYASEEAHATVERAAVMTGLGRSAVRRIRCDRHWRMSPAVLRKTIHEDRAHGRLPVMVVATAGTTSTGVIDEVSTIADAIEGPVWLHVDAAWGALAALSDETRSALAGIERADSVTWDAHKTLGAPVGTGMFFARDRAHVRRVFATDAGYMPGATGDDRVQPFREGMVWSRRFVGLPVFAVLATEGFEGLASRLTHLRAKTEHLRARLVSQGWEPYGHTVLPLVCVTHPRIKKGAIAASRAALTVRQEGVAWISETRVGGRYPALRASVLHEATSEAMLDALADAMTRAVEE